MLPLPLPLPLLLLLGLLAGRAAGGDDDDRPLPSLSGCTTTRHGCFLDNCQGDCGSAPRVQGRILSVFPSGKCSGWQDSCAEPAKRCGCGVCTASADVPCPAAVADGCPAEFAEGCSQDELTNEYCLRLCSALGQRYYGIEAGSQCFCGNAILNAAAAGSDPKTATACGATPGFPAGCTGDGPEAQTSGCACKGEPEEVCGGYRYIEIYEIHGSCTAGNAGWGLTGVLLLALGAYAVGGALLGQRRKPGAAVGAGAAGFLSSHPHYGRWAELTALCWDGVAFARGGRRGAGLGAGQRREGYGSVPSTADSDEGGGRSRGRSKHESKRSGKRGSSGKGRRAKPDAPPPPPPPPDEEPLPTAQKQPKGGGYRGDEWAPPRPQLQSGARETGVKVRY